MAVNVNFDVETMTVAMHFVLVRVGSVGEESRGGLIVPQQQQEYAQSANCVGTVVKYGPSAWKDYKNLSGAQAQIGDRVLFKQFGGEVYNNRKDGGQYRFINDNDVLAVVNSEAEFIPYN